MTQTEVNAAFTEKVRRGIFKPVARHLTDDSTADDRLQIAICMVWEMFLRYAVVKGVVLSDGILVHSCRQRAVDLDRDFVPADGGRRNQDVLDPRAFNNGKVEILRFDAREVGYAEELALRPERKLNSAIDLEAWIDRQTSIDQLILEKRAEGYTLEQIAYDLDLTTSKVFERAKKLGRELAVRAGVRIDRRTRKSRERSASVSRL